MWARSADFRTRVGQRSTGPDKGFVIFHDPTSQDRDLGAWRSTAPGSVERGTVPSFRGHESV